MKYVLNMYDYGDSSMRIDRQEELSIEYENNFSIFSRKKMYEDIINAQNNSDLKYKWICDHVMDEKYLETVEGNIPTSLIENPHYRVLGEDAMAAPLIQIILVPENEQEYDLVLDWILSLNFPNKKWNNGVVQLPKVKGFKEDYEAFAVGTKYITFHAFDEYTGLSMRTYNEYYWVIDKTNLKKNIMSIHCPELLIPHVIGKGGQNIQQFKNALTEYGFIKYPQKMPNMRVVK